MNQDINLLKPGLIITHGLPGCGKSTWSRKLQEENPEQVIIVERDEIRRTLFGEEYLRSEPITSNERQVSDVQKQLIINGLKSGKTVVNSDTNLNPRMLPKIVNLAKECGVSYSQKYFDVPIEECKRRNKIRGENGGVEVPAEVIDRMSKKSYSSDGHIKDFIVCKDGSVILVPKTTEGMKKVEDFNKEALSRHPIEGRTVAIIDMDGSLFNNSGDSRRFLGGKVKDFEGFYRSIMNAPVNKNVLSMINKMRDKDKINIIAITGRSDDYADELIYALNNSGAKISKLIMKRQGDNRPSSEHKADAVENLKKDGFIVAHAIDDRAKDIKMFRSKGITTSIVEVPVTVTAEDPKINTIYGSGSCIRCGSKLKDPNKTIGDKCRTKP